MKLSLTCASCSVQECINGKECREHLPKNCPTRNEEFERECMQEYMKPDINKFYITAGETGMFCKVNKWPRVMESLEFCRRMGYRKIGIASCVGYAKEANICAKIFRREGFEVETVVCSAGGLNELSIGCDTDPYYWDGDNFAVGCNPIGQAKLLNEAGCDFNLVLGLCVGHDALFMKYSEAPTSVLFTKDRYMNHNPLAGIYYGYSCLDPENRPKPKTAYPSRSEEQ